MTTEDGHCPISHLNFICLIISLKNALLQISKTRLSAIKTSISRFAAAISKSSIRKQRLMENS